MGAGLGERAFSKALRKREYQERAQPSKRKRLGLLEKHKDYVIRARDHHAKEGQLKALRVRASNRNPDEYYFGMIRSRMIDGKHIKNATEALKGLPADMLKLLKTQDLGYISLQKNANAKKLQRVEQQLAVSQAARSGPAVRTHVFFAEDEEEAGSLVESLSARSEQTDRAARAAERDSDAGAGGEVADMLSELDESPADRRIRAVEAEYASRKQRVDDLSKLEYKLRLDKQLLAPGKRSKIGTDEYGFAKFRWAVERKK